MSGKTSLPLSPNFHPPCIILTVSQSPGTKAASQQTNCGCQCSSLTFRDAAGRLHGNCKSADQTRAVWCYMERGSTCRDLQFTSTRFPGTPWSYEACATPACGYNNGNYNNGGYNNGGYNNGNYNSGGSLCRNGKCSGSSSGGWGYNPGNNPGNNPGCRGSKCSGSGAGWDGQAGQAGSNIPDWVKSGKDTIKFGK